jgi:hypothetical protein
MTDLREAVARLVDPKLFDDHAPHPWPYLLDEERNAAISVAGDYLRAIEAAGYAIVPRALAVTTDADAVAAARFASLEDTTLLAKET